MNLTKVKVHPGFGSRVVMSSQTAKKLDNYFSHTPKIADAEYMGDVFVQQLEALEDNGNNDRVTITYDDNYFGQGCFFIPKIHMSVASKNPSRYASEEFLAFKPNYSGKQTLFECRILDKYSQLQENMKLDDFDIPCKFKTSHRFDKYVGIVDD